MLTAIVRRLILYSVARSVRDGLDGIHVSNLSRARELTERGPVIFAANHVNWWDGPVMALLNKRLDLEYVVLMEARELRVFSFFKAFGAIGLDREHPEGGRRAIEQMAHGIAGGRSAWIFPQGRQRPSSLRPLGLRPGVAQLAAAAGVPVVPVSLAYPFLSSSRPAAFVDFGEPIAASSDGLLDRLEEALSSTLDRHEQQADARDLDVYELISPKHRVRPSLATALLRAAWNRFGREAQRG